MTLVITFYRVHGLYVEDRPPLHWDSEKPTLEKAIGEFVRSRRTRIVGRNHEGINRYWVECANGDYFSVEMSNHPTQDDVLHYNRAYWREIH